jgi:hypothetical protein
LVTFLAHHFRRFQYPGRLRRRVTGDGNDLHLRRTTPIDQPERKPSQYKPTTIRVKTRSERLVLTQLQIGTLDVGKIRLPRPDTRSS